MQLERHAVALCRGQNGGCLRVVERTWLAKYIAKQRLGGEWRLAVPGGDGRQHFLDYHSAIRIAAILEGWGHGVGAKEGGEHLTARFAGQCRNHLQDLEL